MRKIRKRIDENYGAEIDFGEEVIDSIVERCTEVDTGARNIDKIVNKSLLPDLSVSILECLSEGREFGEVKVSLGDSNEFEFELI